VIDYGVQIHGLELAVADRAAWGRPVDRTPAVQEHLPHLLLQSVVLDQYRVNVAGSGKSYIASEEDAAFFSGNMHQFVVIRPRHVYRIVPGDPQPFREAAQHAVHHESHDLLLSLVLFVLPWYTGLNCPRYHFTRGIMSGKCSNRNRWCLAVVMLFMFFTMASRWPSSPSLDPLVAWSLLAACVAMWVPMGLALLASGGLTEQRAALTALMALAALTVASIGYLSTGFAFQFGGLGLINRSPDLSQLIWEWSPFDKDWGLGWGVIGLRGFFLGADASHPQSYALFLSQLAPLSVAVLLPLLALRGRVKPLVLVVGAALLSMVVYPIVGNWVWGGGWLANLGLNLGLGHGFVDFSGAGTTHLIGATTALAGLLVLCGPDQKASPSGCLPFTCPCWPCWEAFSSSLAGSDWHWVTCY
jgi:hypothetical protein